MDASIVTTATTVTGWARLTTLDGWSALGQAVGGFATVAALGFAAVTIGRWKKERRHERRSDAAARAVSALIVAREAAIMRILAILFPAITRKEKAPEDRLREAAEAHHRTRGDAAAARRELAAALAATSPYLSEHETSALRAMQKVLSRISMDMGSAIPLILKRTDAETTLELLEKTGTELTNEAFDAERRGLAVLGPIARFESDSSPEPLPEGDAEDTGRKPVRKEA